ncbi:MAG: amino acid permease [Pseudomonadota bacterium]
MTTTNNASSLRRDIGFYGAAFLVLNGLIGAGIFALPGRIAENAGLLSPWLFLIVGALFLAVVLTFAELASYYDKTGGPVLYAKDAFGPFAGFSTGWAIYLSRVTAFAANAKVLAEYASGLHPVLAPEPAQLAMFIGVTVGLTWANYAGVKDGVRTMAVLTFLKLTPLALLVILGVQEVTGASFIPAAPFTITELGTTTLALVYAYVGFETVGVTAGETDQPRRKIPRALVATLIATGVLYFLIVQVFVAVIPPEAYATSNLTDVGRALVGPIGGTVIALAAVFSIGGNLSGSMLSAPRLIFAMAEQRTLPGFFARVHTRHATPYLSILFTGGLALVLGFSNDFLGLAVASTVVRLLGYIVCIASLPRIRAQASEADKAEAYRLPGGYTIPLIALAICLWLTAQASAESWKMLGILLAVGGVLYLIETLLLKSDDTESQSS